MHSNVILLYVMYRLQKKAAQQQLKNPEETKRTDII